jgi:hypothetical protein
MKFLREINQDFVDNEITFILNASIHDVPLFKSDIKFQVETRKFIKSIQFRLETLKRENYKEILSKSFMKSGKNTFFTKILSNTNIGIEFYKPPLR